MAHRQSEPRPRPSEQLLRALRASKADLHRTQCGLPLREKVRLVLELQRLCLPLIARQRPLRPWEQAWTVEP
jgi:hypothetical protein